MKTLFQEPQVEVLHVESSDVIATSPSITVTNPFEGSQEIQL